MHTVTAVAHRGDPYRVRENTIDSLRSALDRGADAVEIDVRLTRDGVPVLLHDETLRRLWERDRPLRALTAAEVSGLTDGRVPTLAEALAATEGSRVMLDLPGAPDCGRCAAWWTWCGSAGRGTACTTARAPAPCSPSAPPIRPPRSR
jgi:glycerophosphoryl diester phosphodiesterase